MVTTISLKENTYRKIYRIKFWYIYFQTVGITAVQ